MGKKKKRIPHLLDLESTLSLKKLRFSKKQRQAHKQMPGEMVFVGEKKQDFIRMRVIAFNEEDFVEKELQDFREASKLAEQYSVVWLNIDGLHDVDRIREIGTYYGISSLDLEDIVHTGHRPKFDDSQGALFIILKMMKLDEANHYLESEQFSMYQKGNLLITFQEVVGDVFEPVRERIRSSIGRIRKYDTDYLAFCLADIIGDNYLHIMEYFGEKIEMLDDAIILDADKDTLRLINKYKIELNYLRKSLRPMRDAILNWKTSDSPLIKDKTGPYLEDLNELIERAFDNAENYRNMLSEQLSVYSTNVNNKLNDIVKILTIFSAVFIPLTFIAGIYGTNFEYFPELKFRYSYFIMWAVMFVVAVVMLIFFKRKKWF